MNVNLLGIPWPVRLVIGYFLYNFLFFFHTSCNIEKKIHYTINSKQYSINLLLDVQYVYSMSIYRIYTVYI